MHRSYVFFPIWIEEPAEQMSREFQVGTDPTVLSTWSIVSVCETMGNGGSNVRRDRAVGGGGGGWLGRHKVPRDHRVIYPFWVIIRASSPGWFAWRCGNSRRVHCLCLPQCQPCGTSSPSGRIDHFWRPLRNVKTEASLPTSFGSTATSLQNILGMSMLEGCLLYEHPEFGSTSRFFC